jgi:hypothetical protein
MKNLFSNLLNKKDKDKKTKEIPKKNEILTNIELPTSQTDPQFDYEIEKEILKLPTGQATEFSDEITILDYKGNIIPEHLRFVYIPGKGSWSVDQFERTQFDEYHEKRDLIPKPRLYLFDNIKNKSVIKSNAIKPMIGKNNIILDNDAIELNFESKRRYNYEVSWKEYFKRQIYVQNKSNYENLIQNLFKNKIKQIEYSPQNDFYAETGQFNSYYFHFTDFESALSILIDGYIYPHHKGDEYSSKKKFVHLDNGYDFNDYGTGKDLDLMQDLFNYKYGSCFSIPKVEKLHFAFGFKLKDLKEKRIMYENHIYRYNKRINLKNKEFILLIRNYTF